MKQKTSSKLLIIPVAFMICLLSCSKKDIQRFSEEESTSSAKKTDGQGFAENEMVMYWNAKTSIVLTGPFTPPAQARFFAMVQIAVHDALNAIKPKYERFALQNERNQFASPDAAVASAAYWAIKGMNVQGFHPVDAWYTESLSLIAEGDSKEAG